jgi:hypothetical protein
MATTPARPSTGPVRRINPANAAARAAQAAPPPLAPPARPVVKRGPPEVTTERGRGFVNAQAKDKQGTYYETNREVNILEETFSADDPPAHVRVSAGMTHNLGDYNSFRVDCSVSIPCHRSRIKEAYELCSDFVAEHIAEEEANWLGAGNETKQAGKGRG